MRLSPARIRELVDTHKSFSKVFCIGAHKTGTTSCGISFKRMGLRLAPQAKGEQTSIEALNGHYEKLFAYVEGYEAFQDSPFAQNDVYAALQARFAQAKFILTVREPEDWFRSLTNFHAKIFRLDDYRDITRDMLESATYIYPGYFADSMALSYLKDRHIDFRHLPADRPPVHDDWALLYDKAHFITCYTNRNQRIRDYFSAFPDQLLEIDITQEKTNEKIVRFLGLPEELIIDMPHANKT